MLDERVSVYPKLIMLLHTSTPIMTLHGRGRQLELYADRVIVRPTGRLAVRFPFLFGASRMIYLDEISDVWLGPAGFRPSLEFRLAVCSRFQSDIYVECGDYATASRIVSFIENVLAKAH